MPDSIQPATSGRLIAVTLDQASLGPSGSFIDGERSTAVNDIIAENRFLPAGGAGDFRLHLALVEGKLVLDIADESARPVARHILSMTPLVRVIRDYFLVCESYYKAVRIGGPAQIEAIDMGRRGVHNEGAEILLARLKGKLDMDFATARRLFTLVCALRWRGN